MSEDNRQEEGGGTGLLKRVLKFVTHPNMDWQETAVAGDGQTAPYTQGELKALLERKRRNDIVRQREFSALRRLRNHEALSESQRMQISSTAFDDTMPSPEQSRQQTLNKINQIEDQMSRQWAGAAGKADAHPAAPGGNEEPTVPDTLQPSALALQPEPAQAEPAAAASDEPGYVVADGGATTPAALAANPALAELTDPALEEAAVLFASGNDAQAEQQLLALLAPDTPQSRERAVWRTLLDFYRAVGQQAAFDALALRFTAAFSESAPQWLVFDPAAVAREAEFNRASTYWAAPATLTPEAIAELRQRFDGAASGVWIMDWNAVRTITPGAAAALFDALRSWDRPDVTLHVSGLRTLAAQVAALTPAGDRHADPAAWELRLELLRLFDTPEEFDLEALEYCMAREVSPPAWRAPRCICMNLEDTQQDTEPDPSSTLLTHASSTNFYTVRGQTQITQASAKLTGSITGNMVPLLQRLDDRIPAGAPFVQVACDRLVRIDFAAAGDLLNWVNEKDAHGCQVHFTQAHRLVAIFFAVMGIPAHARVGVRRD